MTTQNRLSESIRDLLATANQLGKDDTLVLRGGGNCSVKVVEQDDANAQKVTLLIKGSGHDMGDMTEESLTPLPLPDVIRLLGDPNVTQDNFMDQLSRLQLDPTKPAPSVESLTHAAITAPFVLHTHADAVQAITDTPNAAELTEKIWGEDVLFVEYASPGLPLGKAIAEGLAEKPNPKAIIVGAHGVFTFGDSAAEAAEKHDWVLQKALEALDGFPPVTLETAASDFNYEKAVLLSALRKQVAKVAGFPLIVTRNADTPLNGLVGNDTLLKAMQRGPVTPDHVTWVGPSVISSDSPEEYAKVYREYVDRGARRIGEVILPALGYPRAILSQDLGFLSAGRSFEEAAATEEIATHNLNIVAAAEKLGGYKPASEDHLFDLEYWKPQRDKYARRGADLPDTGRVVLVTGAASGIGRACAEAFLERGASVIGWDISPNVAEAFEGSRWFGQRVDVTDADRQKEALVEAVAHFGGLDVLVPAAGIFPSAEYIKDVDMATWNKTLAINATSELVTMQLAQPFLANAVDGGYVCAIVSKNVAAPGYGAVAYSSSKAAVTQMCRVAALEWAEDGIRVNMVHPDAVFDTALWTEELLAARAKHYGMSVDAYKRRNLLHAEVTSRKVGDLVATMCSPIFSCTTGAQIPIDGGNERVI